MKNIIEILNNYKIKAELVDIKQGAILTQILVKLAPGMKYKNLLNRFDDIKRELEEDSLNIRTIRGLVAFEIPQETKKTIDLLPLITEKRSENLPILLGVDTFGVPVWGDLAQMPHLLVAGTTGSGKSVALNCFLISLIKNKMPEELKLLIIDPKRVEFVQYRDSGFLLQNPITEESDALAALDCLIEEMERRYCLLESESCRNIVELHQKGINLPFIVCVVDEFADLVLTAGRSAEKKIQSLAQKARACGIHLILATQRPSVDIITGVIKANFPTRIAYKVSSGFDSKTILDQTGAENLTGRGDSFYLEAGKELKRVHCAYICDEDINKILAPFKRESLPKIASKKESKIFDEEFIMFLRCFFLSPFGLFIVIFLFIKYFC